jgi:hypothetical protein
MKKLLLLIPLLFAQQPAFLDYTTLPPQFSTKFANYVTCEIKPPVTAVDNQLDYLQTGQGTLYMKSCFKQSALIPGAPPSFKGTQVEWYIRPDPAAGGQYTARVYSLDRHEWALVAVNLGPPRPDFIAHYYEHLTITPIDKPTTPLPAGEQPDNLPLLWFYTSGRNTPEGPKLPSSNLGYTAVHKIAKNGYRQLYSLVGGGAGAIHQAYGQLVYQEFNLSPNFTPQSFAYPDEKLFHRVATPQVGPVATKALLFNCSVCHLTDLSRRTTLYEPKDSCKPSKGHPCDPCNPSS